MDLEDQLRKLKLRDDTDHDNTRILEKFANQIKTDELSLTKGKTNKDKANRATVENVLDPRTMRFLRALVNRGVLSEFNGCLSTGKEANVYHALSGATEGAPEKSEYAVKIYKTSILVFKDRERYVDGEFRFRNARSHHNPRKMIKIWAEKEFRNLKRIYQSGVIPCPQPVEIKSNVLVMEFLNRGDGFASPRLKDYPFKDRDEIYHYYHVMVSYIRLLYQVCQLVHADLSEYNSIVHQSKLYIIDVSQSVQPEHPMSLDFLRMDIKNINMYFERMGIDIFPERVIFQFVISETLDKFRGDMRSAEDLRSYVAANLPRKQTAQDEAEDQVFRSLHLVRNLGGLEERDFDRFTDGKFDLLKSLIAQDNAKISNTFTASEQYDLSDSDDAEDEDEDADEGQDEDGSESGTDSDSSSDDESGDDKDDYELRPKVLVGKKYEDKDAKKLRKSEAKENKRERRKTKVKKHIKKKLLKKTKSSK
ncbi:AER257Wp [Eremothecium gossypii ATCC 10895]|uniref:Serine/threonine-protein kinase RIO1 n=1 Tax=Eremothecium gossypii (strain ATCC 10895 / CBS 109.51 / FGSC 9923 / NRRL Y-1056) TaxID=284811 RepID=Q756J7_EREGS|nr:AER257Wp [Eremothecium gossypii ATCC 10895]AAS52938.1 AER257Wp [Eremothecium gossypii ATCC 10895]AEY97246.1 FAER257Wp [Eremothecium gossypii FDAG1]